MTVSVFMITYNQEKYIDQAVQSVLSQKTSFDFEIVIGEDLSTDRTREIVLGYEARYPGKIRVIRSEKNVGAQSNAIRTYQACKQKYVALLEGDDYWTDPYKLQVQVDFLEAHPEYVGCFHNAEERYEEDPTKSSFLYCNYPSARPISFSDLRLGNVMPTCSIMYRNNLFSGFPEWFYKLKMADWPMHLLNTRYGDFWYIPKVMAVHRLHSKGIWMLQDQEKNNKYVIDAYDAMIEGFKGNDEHVGHLINGRMNFVESIQQPNRKPSLKARSKQLMIRLIQKL